MRIKLNHPGKDDTLLAICLIFISALLVIFGFYYSAGKRILLPSSYKSAQILCPVWILMSLSSLILGWVLVSEFPLFDPYILGILFVFVGVLALTFKLFIYFIKDNLVQRQLRALQPPQHLK